MIKTLFKYFLYPIKNLISHDGVEHAGYMSFLTMLSLFPFLVFILSLTSFVGENSFGVTFIETMINLFPHEVLSSIKLRLEEIKSGPPESLMTLSIVGTIWTASSSVEGLRTILNRVYHITTPPPYIFRRLTSIAQFLLLNIMIIVAMLILVLIPTLYEKISYLFEIFPRINYFGDYLVKFFSPVQSFFRHFVLVISLFLVISCFYTMIPNKKISFVSVLPGAFLVALGWIFSGVSYSIFISSYRQVDIIYGSLASIIISMIFFFIIHVIFIFGAEFNYFLQTNRKKN